MADKKEEKLKSSYVKGLFAFYFAPKLRSFLTILHFVVWSFVTIYYLEYTFYAVRFVIYTIFRSKILLSISYLFWSLGFILVLAIPFSISFYAILTMYQVWGLHPNLEKKLKVLITICILVGAWTALIFMSDISHYVASQPELRGFIEDAGLNGRL